MGQEQKFDNFVVNGETISVDWSAERQTVHGTLIVPAVVNIRAGSGGFHFGISLTPDVTLQMAAALVEAANAARTAPMTDDRVPS
ncbi:hypothetical protein [Polaromonas sp. YR568]|uniref:hypothetical protein n=1 Tax=Polaromonas sp. YR568 TaxID=1855301 RepID=UPI003137B78B